jgi:hypothetical protein
MRRVPLGILGLAAVATAALARPPDHWTTAAPMPEDNAGMMYQGTA